MSSTVTLVLENITHELNVSIDNALKSIDSLINTVDSDSKLNEYLINQRIELNKYLFESNSKYKDMDNTKVDSQVYIRIKKEIDSLTKRVANIISNKNFIEFINNKIDNESNLISDIIKEYGVMGQESIEILMKNNDPLTQENILLKINELRNKKIDEEKLKHYKKDLEKYIDDQNFESSDLRYELKKIIRKYKSPQELTDCYSYISSKKNEIDKIDQLANSLFQSLNESQKFILEPNVETQLNDNGIIRKIYKLKNNTNNTIDITIDGLLNIQYKLGNYVGHACDKTSDKIIEQINKMGYKIVTSKVSRDISNATRVMYMRG